MSSPYLRWVQHALSGVNEHNDLETSVLSCVMFRHALSVATWLCVTYALPEIRATSGTPLVSRQAPINAYNYLDDTYKLRFKGQCTKQMVHDILYGWAEAGVLANALAKWNPLNQDKYTAAVDHYLGSESRQSAPAIQSVATNQVNVHVNRWPSYDYVYVYCDERLRPDRPLCSPPEADAGVVAYTTSHSAGFRSTIHDLTICPLFYKLPTLADKAQMTRQKSLSGWKDIANTYGTRGDTMLHETFHWQPTIRNPRIVDKPSGFYKGIYGPWNVSYLAEWVNTPGILDVADAWSVTADAMFAVSPVRCDSDCWTKAMLT